MKQILQCLRTGDTTLAEVPAPAVGPGEVLIQTRCSLVSLGTEKMLVQFGRASLFQKARLQPDRVKQIVARMRTEGVRTTLDAVFRRLDEPLPLGYCNAGMVVGVGSGVVGYSVGDRVASNGAHAEIVSVPVNLCAKIPAGVTDDEAAFTVAGAIALQGIRLAEPTLGETVAVIGLGLLGQLAVQLLRANGCRVLGYDFDSAKVGLARGFGAEGMGVGGEGDPVKHALAATDGLGVDAVLITASSSSSDVVAQSARMSRKRGRIVLVGVVGLELSRADFYDKELSFQVSCSYGPGRYEDGYEGKGLDYPAAFVRWTENRNFQAVLQTLESRALNVAPLITRRVPLANYGDIYDHMDDGGLASLLVYDLQAPVRTILTLREATFMPSDGALAIVGAGNFAKMTALPALVAARVKIKTIVSAGGVTATALARKYAVPQSTTDFDVVLKDPEIRGVIICTRHHLHAAQTIAALEAGKHVLVEKPLCLNLEELLQIEGILSSQLMVTSADGVPNNKEPIANNCPTLSVGFNRRFSPHAQKIRSLLGEHPGPLSLVATMNAGAIPLKHWVHDPDIGGGRLVGEACHFIDLAVFVAGSLVTEVCASGLGGGSAPAGDSASILLRHANGSTSVVNYFANGHRSYPKERIEIFSQERVLVLDDFRCLTGFGFKGFSKLRTRQDKGHAAEFAEFARRVREGGASLIPWAELANVARATLAVSEAMRSKGWVTVI